ncbi:hypothetical protein L0Y65_05790 [Candidatus Micrarchaeota archaeon]|nr:hypothetical protein [Candidatus Micrarchaeota archaeon]
MAQIQPRGPRRMLIILGILFAAVMALYGCTQDGGGPNHPRNLTSEDLAPFLAAGCRNDSSGFIDCANASFMSRFGCFSQSLQIMDEGLSLEPSMVLAWCPVEVYGNNLSQAEMEGFFYCGGGLLRTCTSYVAYDGTEFVQIKNPEALARYAGPISGEKEALAFVMLSEDVIGEVERDALPPLLARAQKDESGFLVTAYRFNMFGCYDRIDYEEVRYSVSAGGEIRELGRKVAYTRHLDGAICVD